jgi:hypothetical protein
MKINLSINKEGKHNETYWSDNLKAIEWLFFNTKTIKTKERNKLENFSGTVLIPVFETTANCSIKFEGLEISSKVFYGKKDTYYLAEKMTIHTFLSD